MMDLGPFDGEEKAVSHSADDSHQDYAQGAAERARSGRRRVEVIIGGDRRRRWSPEDKARITAASFVPGANISAVARQYGVSQGLLHCMRRPRPIDFSISCSDLRLIYGPSNELTDEYLTSSL
jgi:transposase